MPIKESEIDFKSIDVYLGLGAVTLSLWCRPHSPRLCHVKPASSLGLLSNMCGFSVVFVLFCEKGLAV